VRGRKEWHGYGVLSQPLTIMGVERRFFLLAAVLGAGLWNAANSLVGGILVFVTMYVAGFFAWRYDQNMVNVVRVAVRYRPRYDAGLLLDNSPYIVVRDGHE
jgi:type IV secretory pathway TrbD component